MAQYFRENQERLALVTTRNLDFPPHIHEKLELVYMVRGTSTAYCQGKQYHLRCGDFFLAFPEQVHHYTDSADCEARLIIADPARLFLDRHIWEKAPVSAVYSCDDPDLVQLLEIAVRDHLENDDRAVTLPLLSAILEKLLKHYSFSEQQVKDGMVSQLVRYCSAHFKEPLTIGDVSKALYVSSSHISHTFNEKLKISFPDYINSLRLDEAVRLLEHSDLSMEQIAEEAGFPTTRTFHRAFRKKYNISPSKYKTSGL
ncbi:MAG: AraC family transcriptional regulator [Oscillospiraceae bacterium]|nr:AraC family transcriptional regulator [Oscillospiraceae bacterium]